MEIKVLKTYELKDKDWTRIVAGFNCSFDRNTTKERLVSLYQSNISGYSYHALCYDHDQIIGFTSIIPYRYLYKEQEFIAGLNCSTFVLKEYRNDVFIFNDMVHSLKKECMKNGVSVLLGVPNKNAHNYLKVFSGSKDVGYLPYYALISGLRAIKKVTCKPIDVFILFCVRLFCFANTLFSYIFNCKEKQSEYRLMLTDTFYNKRFAAPYYSCYEKKNIIFRYRIVDEDGITTAYLMDFRENENRTNKALCAAVCHILRKEKADIILYVGTLRLKQVLLIKVPSRFVPKPLPLIYNILDKDNKRQFDSIATMDLWDFGLMNFDVR